MGFMDLAIGKLDKDGETIEEVATCCELIARCEDMIST